jgi:hypothetical protein
VRAHRPADRRRPSGTDYDPDTDDVVQDELVADAAAAAAREAELREAVRIAARADELQALRELGTPEQAEPREGDEAVRNELTRRAGSYVQGDVDASLTHALAAHLEHNRDTAAVGLLPVASVTCADTRGFPADGLPPGVQVMPVSLTTLVNFAQTRKARLVELLVG